MIHTSLTETVRSELEMDDESTFGFETEGEIKSYLESTGAQIAAVHKDILANAPLLPKDFLDNWSQFTDEWRKFYEENRNPVFVFGISLTSLGNQIDDYVTRTKNFQSKALQLDSSFKGSSPEIADLKRPPDYTGTIQVVAIALGAGLGLGAIAKLVRG